MSETRFSCDVWDRAMVTEGHEAHSKHRIGRLAEESRDGEETQMLPVVMAF